MRYVQERLFQAVYSKTEVFVQGSENGTRSENQSDSVMGQELQETYLMLSKTETAGDNGNRVSGVTTPADPPEGLHETLATPAKNTQKHYCLLCECLSQTNSHGYEGAFVVFC